MATMLGKVLRRAFAGALMGAAVLVSFPASASDASAARIEERLRSYLGNYLQPSEFLVVVRAKPVAPQVKAAPKQGVNLPGLPGWEGDAASSRNYFDATGGFHAVAEEHEPVSVQVIIDKAVDTQKVALFKKIIPTLGGLDVARGDDIAVTTGKLERPPPKEPPHERELNWVDSLMKYKDELTSLGLGLLGAIALLLLINGAMSALAQRAKSPDASKHSWEPSKGRAEPPPQSAAPTANPGEKPEAKPERVGRLGLNGVNRNQVFSRDSMLYQTIGEINKEATEHPERVARLLADWVLESKPAMAAMLLNNFDMQTAEAIISKMVPSDVDVIQPHLAVMTEPFSDENYDVVTKARQDLIGLSARLKRDSNREDFGFLAELDDEILADVLGGEPPETLAIVSTQVPPHRLNKLFGELKDVEIERLFEELCRVNEMGPIRRDEVRERLRSKLKATSRLTLSDSTKSTRIVGLLGQLRGSGLQRKVLERIENLDPAVSEKIRESMFFFEDAISLPERHLRLLAVEVDVLIMTRALYGASPEIQNKVRACLPKAAEEIFAFEMKSNRHYAPPEIAEAQDRVVEALHRLEESGRIMATEIRGARAVAKKPKAAA